MTDRELRKHYLLLANFNETAIGALKARNMLPEGLEEKLREEFYTTLEKEKERREQGVKNYEAIIWQYLTFVDKSKDYTSLTKIAKQYSADSPGYVIQSWMRSRNTVEFLRQWELAENPNFNHYWEIKDGIGTASISNDCGEYYNWRITEHEIVIDVVIK